MAHHFKIVVIGASAGGPDALRRLLRRLPANFPAAVLIVMHVGGHYSILPKILQSDSNMPVRHAEDGEPVEPGVVLVARPDFHLLLEGGMTRLVKGAKENFSRPAVDPLFRTAAVYYRENAIGIILTGRLDDGTIGLQAIKAYGGRALVQDPEDADEPGMPRSALSHVQVDACLPVEALADRLLELVQDEPQAVSPASSWRTIESETRFDLRGRTELEELRQIGEASSLTCPECHGALYEVKIADSPHFRCHTGHSYTRGCLKEAHDTMVEEAMWAAVRALHEKRLLLERFAKSASAADQLQAANEHRSSAEAIKEYAEVLRKMIVGKPA